MTTTDLLPEHIATRDRRRHRHALLNAHDKVIELARKIRTGDVVAVDGSHPTRDVSLCLAFAAYVRRQITGEANQSAKVLASIVREAACVTDETVTEWQKGYADCSARVLAAVESWEETR